MDEADPLADDTDSIDTMDLLETKHSTMDDDIFATTKLQNLRISPGHVEIDAKPFDRQNLGSNSAVAQLEARRASEQNYANDLYTNANGTLVDSYRPRPAGDVVMADGLDTRRDYRGGGGGGNNRGGFNNRKRRFREDDDFDQRDRRQRPRQGHEESPATRLRKLLIGIADTPPSSAQEEAINIAKLVVDRYDDDSVKETFYQVTLKLVEEQPLKIPFVAAVVLFVNNEKSEAAQELLSRAGSQTQEFLDAGKWTELKLFLRFIACLSPLYEEDGVLPILDELFSRAVDLQTASQEDAVGIELVKIILLTLPYLLAYSIDPTLQEKAAEILEKTDIVAATPHPLENLVDPYSTSSDDVEKPMPCTSVITLLQGQLQNEAANGWKLTCLPRVFTPVDEQTDRDAETNSDDQVTKKKHAFPPINVPSPVNAGEKPFFLELFFSVYADQLVESVPPTSNIASSLIRDTIVDTINILDFNRNVVAKTLNELDCFWAPDTFVKRGIAFDKLKEIPTGSSTWKPEDIAIDAIFSQIFQMPTAPHKLVYYHTLIIESCKISPAAIAPSLGRAIRFLFRSLDVMDMELGYRFMDWFSHHLSNFEFRWKWLEWVPETEMSDLHPQKAFILGGLDKEIRLSFAKRIRGTLPENIRFLVPASKDQDAPAFKYDNEQTPYAKEGQQILGLLKKKASEDEIQAVLDQVHEEAAALGNADPLVASTDIYMTAICHIGCKSLSHVLSTIDRCKDRLLAIGPSSEHARRQIISAVLDYWSLQPGTAVNIVDKLLNYTIVTPMSVIEWALRDHMDRGRALASPPVYEMVASTMFKVTNRVRSIVEVRNNPAAPADMRMSMDEALTRERQAMRELFATIEDSVAAVASGAQDEMLERFDGESNERDLIMLWGDSWARVFRRKAAVEEATVGEAVVGELVIPQEPMAAVDNAENGAVEEELDFDVS